jgi:putative peptide zinc metalloprotease protein
VGFGFYWGALSFFVDAGEALMLPRRHRVLQAAAGPFAEMVLAGVASLLTLVIDGPAEAILLTYAVFAWLDIATNLVPFLELDGYWILADLLDRPQLRSQSWQAVRQAVTTRRTDTPWLAMYGAASITFGVVVLGLGLYIWWRVVGDLLQALLQEGMLGWLVALPLALPVMIGWITMILQLVAVFTMRADSMGQRAAD